LTRLTCGVEIPPERLRAMPLAEFCVKCQPKTPLKMTPLIREALAEPEISAAEAWDR
jgi:RNA polymerase-binding transcription factor DksA